MGIVLMAVGLLKASGDNLWIAFNFDVTTIVAISSCFALLVVNVAIFAAEKRYIRLWHSAGSVCSYYFIILTLMLVFYNFS
jgi:hypothetical protein